MCVLTSRKGIEAKKQMVGSAAEGTQDKEQFCKQEYFQIPQLIVPYFNSCFTVNNIKI